MSQVANVFKAFLTQKLEAGGSETIISIDRITTITGEAIASADFALFSRGIVTINPDGDGQSSWPEYASFTAVDTSTLSFTGAIRGLSAMSNSVVAANKRFHPVGTPVVFTFGSHNIQDMVDYIDAQIATLTIGSSQVLSATAGEDVVEGNIVYLKVSDSKWWKADADLLATLTGVQLGVVQSDTSANGTITSGVMTKGLSAHFTGLTANTDYYLSNTAGEVSTSAGTNALKIGSARTTTTMYFDPHYSSLPSPIGKQYVDAVTGMISLYASATPPTGFLLCDGSAVSRTTYAALFAVTSTTFGVGDGSTTFNVPNLASRFPLGYSASAPTKVFTFSSRSSDTITITGADNHALNSIQTGQAVTYHSTSTVITGLTNDTVYYIIRVAYNQLKLASSVANANAGTQITLTGSGAGTQTFTATYTVRPLGQQGGEETHAITDGEMPSHNHTIPYYPGPDATSGLEAGAGSASTVPQPTGTTGGDTVHNNMPLFTVINYIIKT